ncbi:unnamed protein product, partial [Discosporangium mesarthrocarpum]
PNPPGLPPASASMTHFHQDGHGTVDSGHQCIAGRNLVVMLRRMSAVNKKRAMAILCSEATKFEYDALYGLPHSPGEKPGWPTDSQIAALQEVR